MSVEVSTTTSLPKIELTDFLDNEPPEVTEAKQLAIRYRMPYVDLLPPDRSSPVDQDEISKIPVDLMLRNQFVPLKRDGNNLHAAMADPASEYIAFVEPGNVVTRRAGLPAEAIDALGKEPPRLPQMRAYLSRNC